MSIYTVICTKEWRKLGTIEADNPIDALKQAMLKYNTSHVVTVYNDWNQGDEH